MRCWFLAGVKRLRLAPECGLRSRTDWTRACRALTQRKRTKQSAMRCSSTCTNRTWVTARVRTRKQRRGIDLNTALALLASAFLGTAVVLAKEIQPHERRAEAAYHGLTVARVPSVPAMRGMPNRDLCASV